MATWGSGTSSDNNNINMSAGMYVFVGAWGNSGQRITAVEVKTGGYSADKTFDFYIYKGTSEDATGMTYVGKLGSWTFDSGTSTFTLATVLSGLTFDDMDGSAYIGVGVRTSDNNTTTMRGHFTSAAGDIVEYEYFNGETDPPTATLGTGDSLTDPGSLYLNLTYEAAPAASGGGLQLVGGAGLVG